MNFLSSLIFSLMDEKSTRRFFLMASLGMAFSMVVILCTIGLMDGFDRGIKSALKKFQGDLQIVAKNESFQTQNLDFKVLPDPIISSTYILQTQGLIIFGDKSQGIILRGIDSSSFFETTGLKMELTENTVVIGSALSELWNVKESDEVFLALSNQDKNSAEKLLLKPVKVSGVVKHGLYEKDLRIAYISRKTLNNWWNKSNFWNRVFLKFEKNNNFYEQDNWEGSSDLWGKDFRVRPYWQEYATLLEAVKVEKMSMILILQIIVAMAAFNFSAFLTYLNETKKAVFFLYQTLGLSKRQLVFSLLSLSSLLWFFASMMAVGGVFIFSKIFDNIPYFERTAAIYNLDKFSLEIAFKDYCLTFGLGLVWTLCVTLFVLRKLLKNPPISGLRELSY